MSDIQIYGVVAALFGLGTAALGMLGVFLGAAAAGLGTPREGERRPAFMLRLAAGPVACALVGGAFFGIDMAGADGKVMDGIALGCPLVGVGAWIAVAMVLRPPAGRGGRRR